MDGFLHTALAMGCIGGAYWVGKYFAEDGHKNIICWTLDTLETEGYVATTIDEDGEKDLIRLSEVIAKAVEESKETTS